MKALSIPYHDYSDDNDVLSVANIYKECQHYNKIRKQSVVECMCQHRINKQGQLFLKEE
jgi:hypothetical protein